VGENGSEWGKEYLRIFEKIGVRDPLSHPLQATLNAL
jgi:hypothetical protein